MRQTRTRQARRVDRLVASARAAMVEPFIVMDVLRDAVRMERAGIDVVHMEVGQPTGPAPRLVREAAARALREDDLGYTEARGIAPLRERIATHYAEHHGVRVDTERIIITPGSSGAFILALLAAFGEGARVGLANPGYPACRNILRALGLVPVELPAGRDQEWRPSPEDVAARMAEGMAGVLLASPVNPTGAMIPEGRLRELVEVVEAAGGVFISDEIYHRLAHEREAQTALAFSSRVVVINSFSKYYGMTGWRVGWMVVPGELARTVEVLMQNLFISAPSIAQHAAVAAFDATDELEERKALYGRNRRLLLKELPGIGLTPASPPDGAFYLYCDIRGLAEDSLEFSRRALREARVAITPGVDFDPLHGRHHVRLSYCGSHADMERALERLERWLRTCRAG